LTRLKKSHQLPIIQLCHQLGKKPKERDVPSEFKIIFEALQAKYTKGAGNYLLTNLESAMHVRKQGLLAAMKLSGHWMTIVSKEAAGLTGTPSQFKKMAVPIKKYTKALVRVRKFAKKVLDMGQKVANPATTKGPCACDGTGYPGKVGQFCRKWASYDSTPWCWVSNKCAKGMTALHAKKKWLRCKIQNCRVGKWIWSHCKNGYSQGRRTVFRYPSRGGVQCPRLTARKAC